MQDFFHSVVFVHLLKATHLVVVEDVVSHGVFSWHSVCPQLLHEEHLIRQ